MKTVSALMEQRLARDAGTFCTCWSVLRLDGETFAFTDLDRALDFEGTTYKAKTGFMRSAISNSATTQADELEVQGFLDSDEIDERDLRAGLFDYAEVYIFMVDYEAPEAGRVPLRYGRFGEATITSSGQFIIELRGLMQLLQQTVGHVYTPQCRVDLYSKECGVIGVPRPRRASATYQPGDRVTHSNGNTDKLYDLPIPNPDFSETATGASDNWDMTGVELFSGFTYSGVFAFRTTTWLGTFSQRVGVSDVFSTPTLGGGTATLSYQARSNGSLQKSRHMIKFYDQNDDLIQAYNGAYERIGLEWDERSVQVTIPPGTTAIRAGVEFGLVNVAGRPAPDSDHPLAQSSSFDAVSLQVSPQGTSASSEMLVAPNPPLGLTGTPSADGWDSDIRVQNSLFGFFGRNGAVIARLQYDFVTVQSDKFALTGGPVSNADIDTGAYQVTLAWLQAAVTTNGGLDMGLDFFDGSGAEIQSADITPVRIKPTRDWQRRTKAIPVPAGAREARVVVEGSQTDPNLSTHTGIFSQVRGTLEPSDTDFAEALQFGGVEYVVTQGGVTSDGSGGSWSRTIGNTVQDGGVTFEVAAPLYSQVAQITEVFSRGRFRVSGVGKEDNWFQWGVIQFLTGPARTFSQECIRWTFDTQTVELVLPVPFLPEAGDYVLLNAGCDKKIETCANKFGNAINFRGFPDIPGTDFYFKVGNPR